MALKIFTEQPTSSVQVDYLGDLYYCVQFPIRRLGDYLEHIFFPGLLGSIVQLFIDDRLITTIDNENHYLWMYNEEIKFFDKPLNLSGCPYSKLYLRVLNPEEFKDPKIHFVYKMVNDDRYKDHTYKVLGRSVISEFSSKDGVLVIPTDYPFISTILPTSTKEEDVYRHRFTVPRLGTLFDIIVNGNFTEAVFRVDRYSFKPVKGLTFFDGWEIDTSKNPFQEIELLITSKKKDLTVSFVYDSPRDFKPLEIETSDQIKQVTLADGYYNFI